MTEIERIQDQLRRTLEGQAWHGPALREVLKGISAEMAAAKPIVKAHSIWEIVLHVAAWQNSACQGVAGEGIDLADEEDWPHVDNDSDDAWQKALTSLEETHGRLQAAIAGLSDSALKRTIAGRKFDLYFLLHGVIQHNLYHAGQIVLLKKMIVV